MCYRCAHARYRARSRSDRRYTCPSRAKPRREARACEGGWLPTRSRRTGEVSQGGSACRRLCRALGEGPPRAERGSLNRDQIASKPLARDLVTLAETHIDEIEQELRLPIAAQDQPRERQRDEQPCGMPKGTTGKKAARPGGRAAIRIETILVRCCHPADATPAAARPARRPPVTRARLALHLTYASSPSPN